MISALFALVTNPVGIGLGLLVVAALVGLWFLGGPVLFWKIVQDVRLWLAVAFVILFFSLGNLHEQNVKLERKLDAAEQVTTATEDGAAAVEDKVRRQRARAPQTQRIDAAVSAAPEGEKYDAFLDEIARQQAARGDAGGARDPARRVPDDVGAIAP